MNIKEILESQGISEDVVTKLTEAFDAEVESKVTELETEKAKEVKKVEEAKKLKESQAEELKKQQLAEHRKAMKVAVEVNSLKKANKQLRTENKELSDKVLELTEGKRVISETHKVEIEAQQKSFEEKLSESSVNVQKEVIEQVDAKLDAIAEAWIEENKVAMVQESTLALAKDFLESINKSASTFGVFIDDSSVQEKMTSLEESNAQLTKKVKNAEKAKEQEKLDFTLNKVATMIESFGKSKDMSDEEILKLSERAVKYGVDNIDTLILEGIHSVHFSKERSKIEESVLKTHKVLKRSKTKNESRKATRTDRKRIQEAKKVAKIGTVVDKEKSLLESISNIVK